MQKLFTFILLAWTLQAGAQSPCYVRLNDASGYTPTNTQLNDLEAAACRLIDSLPVEFRDSFKVFDFGFYLHNETFSGGYPEAFQMAIQQAQASSKYYLLFGKQTDGNGMYTKFWVDLKLPETGVFGCTDNTAVELLKLGIGLNINIKNNESDDKINSYSLIEVLGINELHNYITKQKICCFISNRSDCTNPCLDSAQLKLFFEDQNFIERNVIVVNPSSRLEVSKSNVQFTRVNDFSQLSVNDGSGVRSLYQDANYLLNGDIPCFVNNNCKVFITKNNDLCDIELFLNIQNEFNNSAHDLVGWIHVWQENENKTEGILFSKFKGEFYQNTESYFEDGSHCPGLPYKAYFHVPTEHVDKLNFQKVKENIEKIYKDKNGFKLNVHLEEKNNLTFFDLYEEVVYGGVNSPGSSDWDGVTGITETGAKLYVDLKSFEVFNGMTTIIDKKHGEYYIAWVTAHEYLHQISHKSYKIVLGPWSPTFYDIDNENIFQSGPHIGPSPNLLRNGLDIPNHHNGQYLPKYYSSKINKFELIDDTLKSIMIRSFLSYALFFDTDPENLFSKLIVKEDKAWLKSLNFCF